jgi:TPR repeat protein
VHLRKIPGIAIALALASVGVAHADQERDGDAAFHNGDYKKALELLMPLAQQGNADAECDIGLMYFTGHGVPQDPAEGAKWFLAAARQGQIGAQVDIGIAYATGRGVQKDYVKGYMWFSVAADRGVEGAKAYRDHVATEMTPDQIERAKRDAKLCLESNFKTCGSP